MDKASPIIVERTQSVRSKIPRNEITQKTYFSSLTSPAKPAALPEHQAPTTQSFCENIPYLSYNGHVDMSVFSDAAGWSRLIS